MRDLGSTRREFFTEELSYHSNNDLRTVSVYGSPMHMRKKRNVYTGFDKFWMLQEVHGREDNPGVVSKISELQQQVSVFEPFLRRTKQSNCSKTPTVRITDEKMRLKYYLTKPNTKATLVVG